LRNSPPPLAQLMRAWQRRTPTCGGAPASGLDRAARLLLRRRRGGRPGAAAAGARTTPPGCAPGALPHHGGAPELCNQPLKDDVYAGAAV